MFIKEYSAYGYQSAVKMVKNDGYNVCKNKTQTWKNSGCPLRDKELRAFAVELFERENIRLAGDGVLLVIKSGVRNRRTHPFKFKNIKRGRTKYKNRCYIWRRDDTGEVIMKLPGVGKKDALIIGKELVSTLQTNLTLEITYEVPNSVAGHLVYTVSKDAALGLYLFVGIEK